MAFVTTFSTLKNDVSAYLDRGASTDAALTARIPQFINEAEMALVRALDIEGFEEPLLFNLKTGENVYLKPTRHRRTLEMRLGVNLIGGTNNTESNHLFARSYSYCRSMWPDDTKTDKPQWYADYGLDRWLIAPTPNGNYPCEVVIKAMPQQLDITNQTNVLTQKYPEIIKLSALIRAAVFTRNREDMDLFKGLLNEIQGEATIDDLKKIADRATARQVV